MSKGHTHHGKTSEDFIDTNEILNKLNLKNNETFMDAGCGDGHIAIEASKKLDKDAIIYAVDIWEPSIEGLNTQIKKEGITNIKAYVSDIGKLIKIPDNTIDTLLLVNVLHGFVKNNEQNKLITELKRVLKSTGRIAIIEFQKKPTIHGPDVNIRISPDELIEIFKDNNMNIISVDEKIGSDVENGYSHYLAIFQNN